jgi:hypothetical protein
MRKWASVVLLAIITGCVPSLNPIYTDKDLIFDPGLVGSWGSSEEKEKWVFSKSGDKAYKLKQTDNDGLTAEFDVRLVRLDEYKFLDLIVTNTDDRYTRLNGWAAFSLIPAHLVLQVHEIGPKLKISAMDPDWVKQSLEKNPKVIDHRKIDEDRYVFIASTKDLQKFVLQHADKEGLFGGPHELERRKD